MLSYISMAVLVFVAASPSFARTSHKDYRELKIEECNDCHASEKVVKTHVAGWERSHGLFADKKPSGCTDCHEQSYCYNCHTGGAAGARPGQSQSGPDAMPESHRTDWQALHGVRAFDNPQTCYRCHSLSSCTECHEKFPKTKMHIKSHLPSGSGQIYTWTTGHAAEARRNLANCQSCHPSSDVCLPCHSARTGPRINPHPRGFKADRMRGRSDKSCVVCH